MSQTKPVQSCHKNPSQSEDDKYESEHMVDLGDEDTAADINEQQSNITDDVISRGWSQRRKRIPLS